MTTAEMTTAQAMTELCNSFHVLRRAPGVDPWDHNLFAKIFQSGGLTSGSSAAARFVLEVWNGSYPPGGHPWWKADAFDVVNAMAIWDQANREAFIEWCEDPFWP